MYCLLNAMYIILSFEMLMFCMYKNENILRYNTLC